MSKENQESMTLEEAYANTLLTLEQICDLFPQYGYDQHARRRRAYRKEHGIVVRRGGIPGKRPDQTIAEALAAGTLKPESIDEVIDLAAAQSLEPGTVLPGHEDPIIAALENINDSLLRIVEQLRILNKDHN